MDVGCARIFVWVFPSFNFFTSAASRSSDGNISCYCRLDPPMPSYDLLMYSLWVDGFFRIKKYDNTILYFSYNSDAFEVDKYVVYIGFNTFALLYDS